VYELNFYAIYATFTLTWDCRRHCSRWGTVDSSHPKWCGTPKPLRTWEKTENCRGALWDVAEVRCEAGNDRGWHRNR